jgi:uncharacterized protein (TIGR00369 family)
MNEQRSNVLELLEFVRIMYEEKIPFNKDLGMKIESLELGGVRIKFKMEDRLIGNYMRSVLHGGVISSVLDATGGLIAIVGLIEKMPDQPIEEFEKRFRRMGTIDLRIDYLRPGQGRYFIASGSIMRSGRRVSVTRMELHNEKDLLIAVGTGTYVVG